MVLGISVEPTTGAGDNKELTLSNNWAETVQSVPVRIGQFDTVSVDFHVDGAAVENDLTGVPLQLSAPDFAKTNEIISEVELTFTQAGVQEGGVIGTVWYDGVAHEVIAGADGKGTVTIEFDANGYDPNADFLFTTTDADGNSTHNSNSVSVDSTSTVRDVHLGEEQQFSDHQIIMVTAVADAPTDIVATDPAEAVSGGGELAFTITAAFVDVDGSEDHFVLVEAADQSWIDANPQFGIFTDPATGTAYFKVPVGDNTDPNPTVTVTLNVPGNTIGASQIELGTGGLAIERADGSINDNGHTISGTVTVDIVNEASLVLTPTSTSAVEGQDLSFTLSLLSGDQSMIAAAPVEVSFTVSGFNPADGQPIALLPGLFTSGADQHGNSITWTHNGDGTYTATATLEPGQSNLDFSVKAALSQGSEGIIDPAEGLRFALSDQPSGLDGFIGVTNPSGEALALDSHFDFTIIDTEYSQLGSHGISDSLADNMAGMELHTVGAENAYDGSDVSANQVIIGNDAGNPLSGGSGDDTIYAGAGNDVLTGGAGADTFAWNNTTMGGQGGLDVITDFSLSEGDTLRFDEFLGGGETGQNSLNSLLSNGTWDSETNTFTANGDGASISLNLNDPDALLTVSYQGEDDTTYTQNVQLNDFSNSVGEVSDAAQVAQMLQDVIKVTG